MAATLTADNHLTYVSLPIAKWEEQPDGNLVVYGKATDGTVDSDSQIVDPDWSAKALQSWMESGPNVRVQHNPQRDPAGNGLSVEIDRDGDGAHWVKSLIVEPIAKTLVKSGALRAYSVGIAKPVIKRDPRGVAKGGIITGGELAELSLVDRPANRNCGITLVKAAADTATKEETGWVWGDLQAALAEATKGDKPTDGLDPDDPKQMHDHGDDQDDDGDREDSGDTADTGGPNDADTDFDDDQDEDETKPAEAKPDMTKKHADPLRAAYDQERAAWLAREPRPTLGDVPASSGTALLVKMAAADRWHAWDTEGEAAGLDGTDAGYARWAAKRNMDPDVGGGVDRDKIPDADHVDPAGRRFPIHSPGDVSDAVSSYGRAKPLIPMKKFRRKLTAIAHRKGPEFVAQLPESWSTTATKAQRKGSVPSLFDLDDDTTTAEAVKGGKDCPSCGHGYDADAKVRRCENCGKKLPKADMGKNQRMVPPDVRPAGPHREPDGDAVEALEHDAGMPTTPDEEHDQVPASVDADGTTRKGRKGKGKPFPGARPPFGSHDQDDDGDADMDPMDAATKSYTARRMHDALCAAFAWDTVTDAYPSLKSVVDAVDADWLIDRARVAAAKGEALELADLGVLLEEAEALHKGHVEPAALADARAELHKAFTDMYPDVSVTPTSMDPTRFRRPYISAGHAALNASGPRVAALPPASHVPHPDDFRRPLITEGHQAEPPGDRGDNLITPSVATGASREFYGTAARNAAKASMVAMHDHIAATYPDMCPMAASKNVLPADMGATNRPQPAAPLTGGPAAPGETATKARKARKARGGALLTKGDMADLVKAAVTEATTAYTDRIAALEAEIAELGSQPDPAQAPLRGAVKRATDADTPDVGAPVDRVSLVEQAQVTKAQAERAEYAQFVQQFLNHPNPVMREQAEATLRRYLND